MANRTEIIQCRHFPRVQELHTEKVLTSKFTLAECLAQSTTITNALNSIQDIQIYIFLLLPQS